MIFWNAKQTMVKIRIFFIIKTLRNFLESAGVVKLPPADVIKHSWKKREIKVDNFNQKRQ